MSAVRYIPEHNAENPDPRPGAYYVSVMNGARYALALGPFDTHAEALERVGAVRRYCVEHSSRAWFYGYGTCRLEPDDERPAGRLNDVDELAEVRP